MEGMLPLFRLSLSLMLVFAAPLRAQQDSSLNSLSDSLLQVGHKQGQDLLSQADSARRLDSIEEDELVRQIEALKNVDSGEKERLQKRLDSVKLVVEEKNKRIRIQVDSLREHSPGIPVVFKKDTLLFIYAKLGPFTPSVRARTIEEKISKISKNDFSSDRFSIIQGEESSDLFYDEIIILSVTDRDAFWLNLDRRAAIEEYKEIISARVTAYIEDTGIWRTLARVGMILLVVCILILMIRFLNLGFSKFVSFVTARGQVYLRGVKIRNYEILTAEREMQLLVFLMNVAKWFFILVIVYTALPVVFSIFPATEGVARRLIGYVLDPLMAIFKSFVGYIPELITIVVIAAVTRYFVKLLRFLSKEVEDEKLKIPGFYPDWAKPTFNLLSFIIHAFAFVVIFPYLPGSESPVFQGVSVFLGLLISLGSSSAIGNIIAGLVITYMRPFKIGERVKIGDTVGDVIEKTMLVTRLRTIKNEDVTIPNAAILNGQTMNFSSSAQDMGLILNTTITIGYDVPWRLVRDSMIEAAMNTEFILKDPKPFVLQTSLDDFYVSYQINAYTREAGKAARIYSDLHANLLDVLHAAGIEIMSPHYRAERDGAPLAVPPKTDA